METPLTYSVKNVLDLWAQVTPGDVIAGLNWYTSAREFTREFSEYSGLSVETCAAIVAAFSINNGWGNNKKAAILFYDNYKQGKRDYGMAGQNRLARVALEESPHQAMYIANKNGLKIRAFYENILGGDRVCVDRWIFRICTGIYTQKITVTPLRYRACVETMTLAFDALAIPGLSLAQFQAILWVAVRRLAGIASIYD